MGRICAKPYISWLFDGLTATINRWWCLFDTPSGFIKLRIIWYRIWFISDGRPCLNLILVLLDDNDDNDDNDDDNDDDNGDEEEEVDEGEVGLSLLLMLEKRFVRLWRLMISWRVVLVVQPLTVVVWMVDNADTTLNVWNTTTSNDDTMNVTDIFFMI